MDGFKMKVNSVVVEMHATADGDCKPTFEVLASGLTSDVANVLADEVQDAMAIDVAAGRTHPYRLPFICDDGEVGKYLASSA